MASKRMTSEKYLEAIDQELNSVFVLHERPMTRFPMHSHLKGQLTYVQGGMAYIFIGGSKEGLTYVIPARHFIWVPGGVAHYILSRSPDAAIRTLYLPSRGDKKHPFFNKVGIYPINRLIYEMLLYTEKWRGVLHPGDSGFSFVMSLKDILPDQGNQTLPIVLPTSTNGRLQPIIQYLRSNIAQRLSMAGVGREFGISERSLARLFKTHLDLSFLQFLKQMRLVVAVEMILQTDMTLSQIAYAVGYGSLAAFSSTFYQVCGMRPSEFANRVNK